MSSADKLLGPIDFYGFGGGCVNERQVFCFQDKQEPFADFPSAIERYQEILRAIVGMSSKDVGVKSYAPLIHQACQEFQKTGQYQVVLILTSGALRRCAMEDTRLALRHSADMGVSVIILSVDSCYTDSKVITGGLCCREVCHVLDLKTLSEVSMRASHESFEILFGIPVARQQHMARQMIRRKPRHHVECVVEVLIPPVTLGLRDDCSTTTGSSHTSPST